MRSPPSQYFSSQVYSYKPGDASYGDLDETPYNQLVVTDPSQALTISFSPFAGSGVHLNFTVRVMPEAGENMTVNVWVQSLYDDMSPTSASSSFVATNVTTSISGAVDLVRARTLFAFLTSMPYS